MAVNSSAATISRQSQRDCIIQPRVGAPATTLGRMDKGIRNPERVGSLCVRANSPTLSGLLTPSRSTQGSSQARNPGLTAGIPLGYGISRTIVPNVSFLFVASALLVFSIFAHADPPTPKVACVAEPFPLSDVRLLDGPFRDAMLRDQKYLLSLDADRLLRNFRVNVGLPSSAEAARWLGGAQL